MSKRVILNWKVWVYTLAVTVIGGAATAATSWLGMIGAAAAGVDVPSLNLKALGVILLSAALFQTFSFLAKSPLPKPEEIEDPPDSDPLTRNPNPDDPKRLP